MRKIFDNVAAQRSLDPDVRTAAGTGENVVDSLGHRDGMLVAIAGDITDTTGDSYSIVLMESDSSTTGFTSTGISITFADDDNSNTVSVARIAELNVVRKRFLRADLTVSAATTSFEGGAIIVLGESYDGPVNDD